jgi:hypothetical protein
MMLRYLIPLTALSLWVATGCEDKGGDAADGGSGGRAEPTSGTGTKSGPGVTSGGGQGGQSTASTGTNGSGGSEPGEIVFFDDFEYVVERDVPGARETFQAAGWDWAKSEEDEGGAGYLYTTTSIDGFAGTFPATGSTRVLALEARPTMYPPPPDFPYPQTDFYLQYGAEGGPLDTIPANVWIQFWVYLADTPSTPSQFNTRNKFFYPTASVDPPFPSADERWLFMNGRQGFEAEAGAPADNFLCMRPPAAFRSDADPVDANKLGQNLSSKQILANEWYLVRLHVDISQSEGVWEAWIRAQSEPELIKIAEWIGGVTPNFTWSLPEEQRSGPRQLRIPTTVNEFDSWMYMDDLYFATGPGPLPD